MTEHSHDGDFVRFREFVTKLDEVKSLILTLDQNRQETSRLRHESIGDKLAAQNREMTVIAKELSGKIDLHKDEDDAVERRVSAIEETQKRIVWVGFAVIPSALTAWEFIKRTFLK